MNRRLFLRGAGGLVLSAPFLPSVFQRTARAQAPLAPRRSVIFHSPCGCLTNRWFPKVEHGEIDASALTGTTLEPLAPFANKLLFPRGLRAVNAYPEPQAIDPHDQAMGSKLTCALLANDGTRYPTSYSLDQEIARQLNPGGQSPLVLSVGNPTSSVKFLLSYSAPGVPQPPEVNPRTAFASLGGTLDAPRGTLEHLQRRRKSVLDAVREDLNNYRRLPMSAADKSKLETWLELLRESELVAQKPECNPDNVGITEEDLNTASTEPSLATSFTLGGDTMIRLIALNLLCDTNRSAVLSFPSYAKFDWDGIHHEYDHDGLAHRSGTFAVGGPCLPGVLEMLAQIDAWYAAKFTKLVSLLDSLPEGDGSLLDNTATVWLQEFSDGGVMNFNNMPIVIAGSAGGYLKQGQAVNVEGTEIGTGNSEASCGPGGDGVSHPNTGSTGGNVPINKLYVTLLNALGCTAPDGGPVTQFGQFDGAVAEDGITDPGELSALKA